MAKSMKRLLALLLALMMCVALLPAAALAEEDEEAGTIALAEEPGEEPQEGVIAPAPEEPETQPPAEGIEEVYSGRCGNDLTWRLDEATGTLAIVGTGDMWDWGWMNAPWYYRRFFASAELPDGLTGIGNSAFYCCSRLASLTIPESVTRIGESAFSGCSHLKEIYFAGTTEQWHAISIGNDNSPVQTGVIHCSDGIIDNRSKCGDDLTWTFDKDTGVLTISGTGDMWDWSSGGAPWYDHRASITSVELPEGLTSIRSYAFRDCSSLTSVTIPAGVTYIGWNAFEGCSKLTSVTIPASVTSIGYYVFLDCSELKTAGPLDGDYNIRFGWTESIVSNAFYNCSSLESVEIPASVTSIGAYAFGWCSGLTSVEIPAGVTSIGNSAFRDCSSLESVEIPAGVTSIGNSAFRDCSGLTAIEVAEENENYSSLDGILYNKEQTALIQCPGGKTGAVEIPASVTRIGESAFSGCSGLTDVYFAGTMEQWLAISIAYNGNETVQAAIIHCSDGTIDNRSKCGDDLTWSFNSDTGVLTITGTGDMQEYLDLEHMPPWYEYRASITSVELPEGLTSIGERAFYGCSSLESVTLPAGVTRIGSDAFSGCSGLTAIEVAEGNKNYSSLDGILYNHARTTLLQCPKGKSGAAEIPAGVTSIGRSAFEGCSKLTSVTIPEGVTDIGSGAFSGCSSLESVTIPEGVTEIKSSAFYGCSSLTSVTLPEGLNSIGGWAFEYCHSLESVTIPESVTSIGEEAFSNCSSLTAIEVAEGNENYSSLDGILYDKQKTTLIQCPGGKSGALEIPAGLTGIGDSAFEGCSKLTSVTIPAGVTSIGWSAFEGCSGLTSVTIPEGLTYIGDSAFEGCSKLTSVTIPAGVTSISGAFSGCSSLESVTLPEGLTGIWDFTFRDCSSLKSVTLPVSLTSIGWAAFRGCSSLESVTIPENVTKIYDAAFYGCSSLKSVTIPASMTAIGEQAFSGCSGLKRILFLGRAPAFTVLVAYPAFNHQFEGVTATAWYPDDGSWLDADLQDYGGKLTWVPYTGEPVINPFTDVQEGKYYYLPVLWAISQDPPITSGTGEGTFSPNQTCTRAQIVTFIWNAFGQPEPSGTNNPFEDVPEGKWYTKAVLWAVEKGITSGVDARHFGPNKNCTRAQVVTFLWNAYEKPEPTSTVNPFKDVKEGKYYYKAVLWAVEMGITSGMSADTFGTDRTCTRGQVVTFLYNTKDIPKPV